MEGGEIICPAPTALIALREVGTRVRRMQCPLEQNMQGAGHPEQRENKSSGERRAGGASRGQAAASKGTVTHYYIRTFNEKSSRSQQGK